MLTTLILVLLRSDAGSCRVIGDTTIALQECHRTIGVVATVLALLPLTTGTEHVNSVDSLLVVTHTNLALGLNQIGLTTTSHDYIAVGIALLTGTATVGSLVDTAEYV